MDKKVVWTQNALRGLKNISDFLQNDYPHFMASFGKGIFAS